MPASAIIEGVSSQLSRVPVRGRRQFAATLLLFATLFVAIGAVAATGGGTAAAPVFSAIALAIAVLLGLVAWGLLRSVKLDLAEQRLDAAIEQAVAASGGALCSCGHDHDPDEMHVSTDACAHDGTGSACAHDCETCVVAALRSS